MSDLRQSENWANYMKTLGWEVERIEDTFVYIKKIGMFSVIKIHRLQNLNQEKFEKIDALAKDKKALFTKLELDLPKAEGEEAKWPAEANLLKENGYAVNLFPLLVPSTIIIDLKKNTEKLWKELSKDARYSVNRTRREGLEIEIIENPDDRKLKEYQSIFEKAGKERKLIVPSLEDLKARTNAFKDENCFIAVKKNNEMLSAGMLLFQEETAYYNHLSTTKEGRKCLANYRQLWEIIVHLKNKGLGKFDLDGIRDERFPKFTETWAGFSFFKDKFGGEVFLYPPPFIKYYSRFLKLYTKFAGPLPL